MVAALGPQRLQAGFAVLSPQLAIWVAAVVAGAALCWQLAKEHEATFRAVAPLVAMAALGPVIFYLHWPYLWHHPVDRTAWYLAFHLTHNHYAWFYLGELLRAPPFPLSYVLVKTALTVPTSLFVPMVLGVGWVGVRAWREQVTFLEVLVLANALTSIAIISQPQVPHFGGVKHWFPSMPFLAVLSAGVLARGAKGLAAGCAPKWKAASEPRGASRPWRWRARCPALIATRAALRVRHQRLLRARGRPARRGLAGHAAAVLGEQPHRRAAVDQRQRAPGERGVPARVPRRADSRLPAQRHAADATSSFVGSPVERGPGRRTSTTRSSASTSSRRGRPSARRGRWRACTSTRRRRWSSTGAPADWRFPAKSPCVKVRAMKRTALPRHRTPGCRHRVQPAVCADSDEAGQPRAHRRHDVPPGHRRGPAAVLPRVHRLVDRADAAADDVPVEPVLRVPGRAADRQAPLPRAAGRGRGEGARHLHQPAGQRRARCRSS